MYRGSDWINQRHEQGRLSRAEFMIGFLPPSLPLLAFSRNTLEEWPQMSRSTAFDGTIRWSRPRLHFIGLTHHTKYWAHNR